MICIVDPQLNNYNMFSGIWIFKWYEWSNNSIIVTSSFPKFICCFVLYFHVAPNSQNDVKIKLETISFPCSWLYREFLPCTTVRCDGASVSRALRVIQALCCAGGLGNFTCRCFQHSIHCHISFIKNMVVFTKGASVTSHGSSMKYANQFVYQPWVKDTSLWTAFLAQLFYHLRQLPHLPLFPTQGTFISLTSKIQTDCITNWLWLLKTSF